MVNAVNTNKLPVEYMVDKLQEPNDYTSLLKIHHLIRDEKSNFSSKLSKKDNEEIFLNNEKENNTPNQNKFLRMIILNLIKILKFQLIIN